MTSGISCFGFSAVDLHEGAKFLAQDRLRIWPNPALNADGCSAAPAPLGCQNVGASCLGICWQSQDG